jgi:hypothetical protein
MEAFTLAVVGGAALLLLSVLGILIFMVLTALQHRLLRRQHESAMRREN